MCREVVSRFAGGVASAGALFRLPPEPSSRPRAPRRMLRRPGVASRPRAGRGLHPLSERFVQYVREARTQDEMLDRLSDLLGFQLACVVVVERAVELGVDDIRGLADHSEELVALQHQTLPDTRWARCLTVFEGHEADEAELDGRLPDLASQAERVEWLLGSPDLKVVEANTMRFTLEVRVRFEAMMAALKAAVARIRRHSDQHRLVGRLFQQGAINAAEVADLLRVPVPDALVFLDEGGYRRETKDIAPDRAAILERLARARERGDRWWEAPELVRRSAIATQRIESIDAREH